MQEIALLQPLPCTEVPGPGTGPGGADGPQRGCRGTAFCRAGPRAGALSGCRLRQQGKLFVTIH